MEREFLKNGSLRIFVSEQELAACGLSFSALDVHSGQTRALLGALLLEAGVAPQSGLRQLTVEALPVSGGVLFLLTPAWQLPRRLRLRNSRSPLIYTLADADALLALARGWRRLHPSSSAPLGHPLGQSSLYRMGERYLLLLYPLTPLSRSIQVPLHTFGTASGSGDAAAAFIEEHGTALCIGDALSRLCGTPPALTDTASAAPVPPDSPR